jgi:hypothetical protein
VEYTPGTLKRIDLFDPLYPTTTIATGLNHPVGLALDVDQGLAMLPQMTSRVIPPTQVPCGKLKSRQELKHCSLSIWERLNNSHLT